MEKFWIDHEGKACQFDEADIATIMLTNDWAMVRILSEKAQAETDSESMIQHIIAFVDGRGLTEIRLLFKGKTSYMVKKDGNWVGRQWSPGFSCAFSIILVIWTCYQMFRLSDRWF